MILSGRMRPIIPLWVPLLGLLLCCPAWAAGRKCDDVMSDPGSGANKQMHWSYDNSKDLCQAFLYSGNGKSTNVFSTEQECLKECSHKYNELYPEGAEVCSLPLDKGPCMALIFMWYYDSESKKCDSFFYGGCQGNGNRFEDKQNCTSACNPSRKGKSGSSSAAEADPPQSSTDEGMIVAVVFSVIFAVAFIVSLTLFLRQRKAVKKQEKKHKFVAVEMR